MAKLEIVGSKRRALILSGDFILEKYLLRNVQRIRGSPVKPFLDGIVEFLIERECKTIKKCEKSFPAVSSLSLTGVSEAQMIEEYLRQTNSKFSIYINVTVVGC